MTGRWLLPLVLFAGGCAGRSTHSGSGGTGGTAAGSGGGGSGGSSGSGAAAGRTGEDACAPLGNNPNVAPGRKGCYAFDEGRWLKVPCECEIKLENPSDEAMDVELVFTAYTGGLALSFTESPSVDLVFDDLDGRYFATWEQHPENGSRFLVSRDGPRTHVALGAESVELPSVSLNVCEARYAQATVHGPDSVKLLITVRTSTSTEVSTWSNNCTPLVPPPRP
jgi:hypothetical protein